MAGPWGMVCLDLGFRSLCPGEAWSRLQTWLPACPASWSDFYPTVMAEQMGSWAGFKPHKEDRICTAPRPVSACSGPLLASARLPDLLVEGAGLDTKGHFCACRLVSP